MDDANLTQGFQGVLAIGGCGLGLSGHPPAMSGWFDAVLASSDEGDGAMHETRQGAARTRKPP